MSDPRVTVLVPACNEADQIQATLASLWDQTLRPYRIIVIANNCTDDTERLAGEAGAEVLVLASNPDRKAGALNAGLASVLPYLTDRDLVLMMDADSVLCPTWLADASAHLNDDPALGAVSGAYVARKGKGLVSLLQRAEYAQERRRISRRGGRVDVLSGTAVLVTVRVLREVAKRGFIYDPGSWTEDFEFTLAVQALGYSPHCFRELLVVTDVMESWSALSRQRIRWQRGTLETLWSYRFNSLTWRLWTTQAVAYGATAVTLMMVFAWWLVALGSGFDLRWLAILPIFMVEQVVSSRRAGWGPTLLAACLIPGWGYDVYRLTIYWVALTRSVRRVPAAWS